MRHLKHLAGLVPFILVSAGSGAALAAKPDEAPTATVAPADSERMICRRVEETGSRLKAQRVCMTRAQWDEQRRQNRLSIERSQTQTRVDTPEG